MHRKILSYLTRRIMFFVTHAIVLILYSYYEKGIMDDAAARGLQCPAAS
jgi:hypothetical protein